MGDEGADIRIRLKNFYRLRALNNLSFFREHLGKTA
jgi:hypothetical protein